MRQKTLFHNLTIGFELEYSHPSINTAQKTEEISRIGDIKHDGTVYTGFELASNIFNFNDFTGESSPRLRIIKQYFEKLRTLKPSTESEDGAGMHIHVGRQAIDPARIYDLNKMIVKWRNFIEKIGERAFTEYCSNICNSRDFCLKRGKYGDDGDGDYHDDSDFKYRVLNVIPEHTVEFRFFKSTASFATFIKNMQFAVSVFHFTKNNNYTAKSDPLETWAQYIDFCLKHSETYPFLLRFFEKMGFVSIVKRAEEQKIIAKMSQIQKLCSDRIFEKFIAILKSLCGGFPAVNVQCLMAATKHLGRGKENCKLVEFVRETTAKAKDKACNFVELV